MNGWIEESIIPESIPFWAQIKHTSARHIIPKPQRTASLKSYFVTNAPKPQPKPAWETESASYDAPKTEEKKESYALLNSKEYFVKKQSETANVEPKTASNLQMVAEDLSDNKTVEKIAKP